MICMKKRASNRRLPLGLASLSLLAACAAAALGFGGCSSGGGNDGADPARYALAYRADDADSGSVPAGGSYEEGESVQVADNTDNLARAGGYAFDSWNTAADGSGAARAPLTYFAMPANDLTLYARWASDGSHWRQPSSTPSYTPWAAIAYGGGSFVAIASSALSGDTSALAETSPDGIAWVEGKTMPALDSGQYWTSLAYGGGLFVAVSRTGTVAATSPDGATWTARSLPSSQTWVSIAYGANAFVAISQGGKVAATSPDGIAWTARSLPSSQSWAAVAYGGGTFVAVASGNVNVAATSPDGKTWTQRALPSGQNWCSVAYSRGMFVAIANLSDGNAAASSPDGVTWTARSLPGANFAQWNTVVSDGPAFVAIAKDTATAASSPDGATWIERSLPTTDHGTVVASGKGRFVVPSSVNGYGLTSP